MMMRTFLASIPFALALLSATGLSAQPHPEVDGERVPATGLIVGVNVTGSLLTLDDVASDENGFGGRGREGGGGMHFTLGYGFTPAIAVLLHAGGVMLNEDDERVIGGVDLALRYSLAAQAHSVVPYLEMAVGGVALENGLDDGAAELTGGSLSLAAGLNFFVTPRFAFNADFRYNMGMFTEIARGRQSADIDPRLGFSASRVNVGFNWHPMAGR